MRRIVVTIGALALAASTAACGGSSHPAASATTTTASTTTSTVATPTTAAPATTTVPASVPASSSTTATTAPAGPAHCSSLSIAAGQSQGAAGTIGVPLVFTNTGRGACVLGGFPGVAMLDASGAQAVQAARVGSPGAAVTLAPGASASALLTGSDVPRGNATSCPTYQSALVTPPGSTVSQHVSLGGGFPGCATPSVRSVVAGSAGM